ncbi:Proteinase inhibitor I12 [Vigna unguiculata]|uniref:Proteinase inhibitor I12 n=1 Tax=Vigna unguiculata TaxID=3917 RepID=A0A4D6NIA1_VIGUN|nr:Proteinase inhibitor I12 [Vigna unguiculata]
MRIHSEDKENLSVLGAERESESNAEVESNDEVFSAVDARFDPTSFITQVLPKSGENYVKSTSTACCDLCVCTRSIPPQCRCLDIVENSCHSACDYCICATSEPPMCRCMDQNSFCYPSCSSNQ